MADIHVKIGRQLDDLAAQAGLVGMDKDDIDIGRPAQDGIDVILHEGAGQVGGNNGAVVERPLLHGLLCDPDQ